MRIADLPMVTFTVRFQDKRPLSRANQYSYLTHSSFPGCEVSCFISSTSQFRLSGQLSFAFQKQDIEIPLSFATSGVEDDLAGMQKVNAIADLVMLCILKMTGSVQPVS